MFSNCQTLVNPVSCDGTIDSYLSKRFFMRYPAMYTKYLQFCKEKQFTPGKLWVYQGKTKNILNFPIKEISNLVPQPKVVKASFMRLAETYQDRNISSIAFLDFSNPTYSTMEPKFKKSAMIFCPYYQSLLWYIQIIFHIQKH